MGRKASIRAFEDLKGTNKDNTLAFESEMEVPFKTARHKRENKNEDPPLKARLTLRSHKERKVRTGLSRSEE
ncbi:hypothetical protein ACFP1I_21900 [Dyadobacter subterraneus]|uniref:Uncharacterized protein n=1 Tax=Dyadobacter subterraneus TaxID=2773304 RepID=A0ABR9W547_9BACT|nr:hypothetical protein [Dyadobacter subterraneus]MBE9460582.1 hypothetical protein [Dyadobacter subterraneus]